MLINEDKHITLYPILTQTQSPEIKPLTIEKVKNFTCMHGLSFTDDDDRHTMVQSKVETNTDALHKHMQTQLT